MERGWERVGGWVGGGVIVWRGLVGMASPGGAAEVPMELAQNNDLITENFQTYEDYLDSQITEEDLYYLEDIEMARQLVELGHMGQGEILKREDFLARKEAAEIAKRNTLRNAAVKLAGAEIDLEGYPLLQELQKREEAVRSGKLSTIVFLRDRNLKGHEVSGYIDFAHRLRMGGFEAIFSHKKRLMPTKDDLSYFNWETQTATINSTTNFQVIAEHGEGLLFKNKRDRKTINVDPLQLPGDNSTRVNIQTEEYIQAVIYDHVTRRRA